MSRTYYHFFSFFLFSTDVNECNPDVKGNCSHLCVNSQGSYYCKCPNGFQMSQDNKTCKCPKGFQESANRTMCLGKQHLIFSCSFVLWFIRPITRIIAIKWCFARVKNDTKTLEKNWHKLSDSFKYIYIVLFTISYSFNPVHGLLIISVAAIILCSSIN